MDAPAKGWRRHFTLRSIVASSIGAILLILAIWFDVVWIALLGVMMLGGALLFIQWLVETIRPGSSPWSDLPDEDS